MVARVNSYYFTDELKKFDYMSVNSVNEAVGVLQQYKNKVKILAGGTKLIPALRLRIFSEYPEKVISLKNIKELKYIKEESGLKIGALTALTELIDSEIIKNEYSILTDAAISSAPPQLRNLSTVAGDICQELNSWYIWNPNPLVRDLDSQYIATEGMNQYLSIFGGAEVGYATNISNLAIAFTALNASIVTTKKTIPIEEFYSDRRGDVSNTVLEPDEIITEIQIPKLGKKTKKVFMKFSLRKFIDSPLVAIAIVATKSGDTVEDIKIVLGSVGPKPIRATKAEEIIKGNKITKEMAEKAGEESVYNAQPLSRNGYKVKLTKVIVKRALLSL